MTSLVKKLDDATLANKGIKMGSFLILLSDDDKQEEALTKLAEKQKIKKLVLCTDNSNGPPKWKIDKDADVTVVLYTKNTVVESFAFGKGKLDDKAIDKVVAGVEGIKPKDEKDK